MVDRIADDGSWLVFNKALIDKATSSPYPRIRLAILEVIEHLFEGMRERYLVILNDTIPFLSEMLEDEDE